MCEVASASLHTIYEVIRAINTKSSPYAKSYLGPDRRQQPNPGPGGVSAMLLESVTPTRAEESPLAHPAHGALHLWAAPPSKSSTVPSSCARNPR